MPNSYESVVLPTYVRIPVETARDMSLDLGGAWTYLQPVTDPFAQSPLHSEVVLQVPGEVVMQGLPFDADAAFALERIVAIPAIWAGRAIRLRFEAVYSQCEVWVNGKPAGHHMGGFTPFDLDLTDLVTPGENARLTLHVNNNSIADTLAQATKYAFHPLAGIPRKVTLFALPASHLEQFEVATLFERGDIGRATLRLDLKSSAPGAVDIELTSPQGQVQPFGSHQISGSTQVEFSIEGPELWHTENPALYTVRLIFAGSTYVRRVGFRDVRVEGGRILLNGRSIYLRGANHHETHPLTGRADTARWAETDVKLFRAAHVNFLRTSHYPPTIELVEACDEAGMLLEIEAPFCFAFGHFGRMPRWDELSAAEQAAALEYVPAVSLEMVSYYRSHASVIVWSVANESAWAPPFERSASAIRRADPTRPTTYNWDKLMPECSGHVDIANHHYPEAGEVARFASEPRPVMFDEFAHLYCYNSREMVTDPGLRQLWGKFFRQQWEEVRTLANGIGGSIWAAIDDHFLVPQRDGTRKWVGYGEWGPLDGWRRPKPEYEHVKDVFDPVHVVQDGSDLTIENRFDFTDLSEVECEWRDGDRTQRLEMSGQPGESASIRLPSIGGEISFRVPSLGYERKISFSDPEAKASPSQHMASARTVETTSEGFRMGGWQFLEGGAGPMVVTPAGQRLDLSLGVVPSFEYWEASKRPPGKVEPVDNMMTGWRLDRMVAGKDCIDFSGAYSAARGAFSLSVDEDDVLSVRYDFEMLEGVSPLQIGLSLNVPVEWDRLCWKLAGPDNHMPEDHISRSYGDVRGRNTASRALAAGETPSWPWKDDLSEYGTNDTRSTKLCIERAGLFGPGGGGVMVLSDGTQHVRAEIGATAVRLFALDWSGEGSERFLATFAQPVNYEKGHRLRGAVRLAHGPWKNR